MIAEKQPLIAAGLKFFITAQDDFILCGEASDRSELLAGLLTAKADLLIISPEKLPGFRQEDFYRIREKAPETSILVITSTLSKEIILQMTDAGVIGILTKECSQNEILSAIRANIRGEKFFCGKILDVIMEKESRKRPENHYGSTPLNSRELEIIRHITEGQSTKEIAARLNLSMHTINAYRKSLLKKMEVHSPAEMAIKAIKMGIIEI